MHGTFEIDKCFEGGVSCAGSVSRKYPRKKVNMIFLGSFSEKKRAGPMRAPAPHRVTHGSTKNKTTTKHHFRANQGDFTHPSFPTSLTSEDTSNYGQHTGLSLGGVVLPTNSITRVLGFVCRAQFIGEGDQERACLIGSN